MSWANNYSFPHSIFSGDKTRRDHEAFAENMARQVRDIVYGGAVPSVAPVDVPEKNEQPNEAARARLEKLLAEVEK